MNFKKIVLSLAVFLSGMSFVLAEVPSLINYQGRLTESNGAPVTGTKTVSLAIYDSAVNGKVLYTESIGPVVFAASSNNQTNCGKMLDDQVLETGFRRVRRGLKSRRHQLRFSYTILERRL